MLLERVRAADIPLPVRADEAPLGPDRVFISGNKEAAAAGLHGFARRALGNARLTVCRFIADGDRCFGGVRRAGLVAEVAVDRPAVECGGDIAQAHLAGVAAADRQAAVLLDSVKVVDIPLPVRADEVPLGQDRVFVSRDKETAAAGPHGLPRWALGDKRLAVRGLIGNGDRRLRGKRRTDMVTEAAVDRPAVQALGDAPELHGAGIAVDDLQSLELRGGLVIVEIALPIRADKVPLGPDRVFIVRDKEAAAADRHCLAGGVFRDRRGRAGCGRTLCRRGSLSCGRSLRRGDGRRRGRRRLRGRRGSRSRGGCGKQLRSRLRTCLFSRRRSDLNHHIRLTLSPDSASAEEQRSDQQDADQYPSSCVFHHDLHAPFYVW